MHELASSVDDHIVSIEFNVSGARGKATIEGMSSISFGQSHAEEARRPRAKNALVEGGGVNRTPVFNPVVCVCSLSEHSLFLSVV